MILFGSLVFGLIFNRYNTKGIALFAYGKTSSVPAADHSLNPKDILSSSGKALTLKEAYTLFEAGAAVFIDARPPSFYETEHIKNAISVYYKTAHQSPELERLNKNDPLVVYCKGPNCNQAQLLMQTMQKAGFTNLFLFPGGMQEWRLAQYPMDKISGEIK